MAATRYYLGKKHAGYATAELALAAAGFAADRARLIIDNARVNASESIVVGLYKDRPETLVVTRNEDETVTLWQAMFGDSYFFDSEEEALKRAAEFSKTTGDDWAVFEWKPSQSRSLMQ